MKTGKAIGYDGTIIELLEYAGRDTSKALARIYTNCIKNPTKRVEKCGNYTYLQE